MMLTSPGLSRNTELYIPAIPFLHIQCIQRNQNQDLKEMSALPWSWQHYSQMPRYGNKLSVDR